MKTVLLGLMIPFAGTAAGSSCVFLLKNELKAGVQRALTGFAAGVMTAASIWSLLNPAIDQSESMNQLAFLPAFIGFWLGILFLLLLDHVVPHLHRNINQVEGPKNHLTRTAMVVLAVTLHNIPEGMAVGVVFAGMVSGSGDITAGGAMALSLGIAIQNFPEGAISADCDRCRTGCTCHAISSVLCSRGNALRCCGRTHSGDVCGRAFQHRCRIFCGRLQRHDGTGCGIGIIQKRIRERGRFYYEYFRVCRKLSGSDTCP